jgi:hypothetical protein
MRIITIAALLCLTSCQAAKNVGTMAVVGFILGPYIIVDRITETKDERAERLRWKADRKASQKAWVELEKGNTP